MRLLRQVLAIASVSVFLVAANAGAQVLEATLYGGWCPITRAPLRPGTQNPSQVQGHARRRVDVASAKSLASRAVRGCSFVRKRSTRSTGGWTAIPL